jgi:hypothetical protein
MIVIASPANIALSESIVRTSLAEMLGFIPARPRPGNGVIDTRHSIATLARQWPHADEASREVLRQLARRLAINKQLDESYTVEWRRQTAPRELAGRDHYWVAVLLLAFAFMQNDGVDGRGESLHLANGALFARDRSIGVEPVDLARFDTLWAHLIAGRMHG